MMFANLLAEENLNFFQKSGGFMLVLLVIFGAAVAAAVVIWLFKVAKPENQAREAEVKAFNAKAETAVAEAPVEEPAKEEVPAEEPVEEKAEEPAPVEEAVEEKAEEPAPAQEEPAKEEVPAEEPVEEKAEEPAPAQEEPAKEEVKKEKKAPAKKPAAKKASAKKPAAKKAPAKKPVVAAVVANDNDNDEISTGANGKWRIEKEDVGFISSLYANNGQLLLNSESYTTFKGAAKGIDTIKKNAENGVFHVTEDKNGRYFFKLLSKQNRVICVGATYASKDGCESAIESVKNFCKTAILVSVDPDEAAKAEAAASKN